MRERRKTRIADSSFQYRYVLQLAILQFFAIPLTIFFTLICNFLILHSRVALTNYWLWLVIFGISLLFIMIFGLVFKGIQIFLRIAGLIIKLMIKFEMLLSCITEVLLNFLKEDEWHELSVLFNKLAAKIQDDASLYQDYLLQILELSESLQSKMEGLPPFSEKNEMLIEIRRIRAICLQEDQF